MYYKVIYNGRVIDVLNQIVYLKYQKKHNIMVICTEDDAEAILSSDATKVWHEKTLYAPPVPGYDTVTIEEIDKYEYDRLRVLNCMTPDEIIDNYTLSLINEGVI